MKSLALAVLLAFLALVSAAGAGCYSPCRSAAVDDRGGGGATRGGLVTGKLRAIDFGNHVVLYASGFNGSTGVRTVLLLGAAPDGRPEYRLYGEANPYVAVGARVTPFLVSEVLPPLARKTVRVRDAGGVHEVPVEPAEAVSLSEWEQLPRDPSTQPSP